MSSAPAPVAEHPIVAEIERAADRLRLGERSAELDRDPAFPRTEFRELGRLGS